MTTDSPTPGGILGFLGLLRWIDGTPLLEHIEPYRRRLFEQAFAIDALGRLLINLILAGRAKKNAKSLDLVLAGLYALLTDSPGGSQCYLLANDEGQAADALSLAKKLVAANPELAAALVVKQKRIERADGAGFLEILPAGDVRGAHGKTYRFCGFDEIHAYRTWDLLEAMQPDPTRADAQVWITSYASLYHAPGAPLFDLLKIARAGTDPRMLFSWYAADFTTDPEFADADPETRANPSRGSWADEGYLEQQRRRLPAHQFRRLHLNLPGLPEGSAFAPEPILDAITRDVRVRPPERGVAYTAFVDMSGGSSDDAVLAIGHRDAARRIVVDRVVNQGSPPPFDPRAAVARFAGVLREYGVATVTGDAFAGQTFAADFQRHGIRYRTAGVPKSRLYELLEPGLNAREVILPDAPLLEQQLLGLVWRGGRIDHVGGEHDDWANATAGVVALLGVVHDEDEDRPDIADEDRPDPDGERDRRGATRAVRELEGLKRRATEAGVNPRLLAELENAPDAYVAETLHEALGDRDTLAERLRRCRLAQTPMAWLFNED